MSIGWQSAAQLRESDAAMSHGVGAAHGLLADFAAVSGRPLAFGAATHITSPFGGAHALSPTAQPIPGPGTSTVVFNYTAILKTCWYSATESGPPVPDHPIILTYSFETAQQDYLSKLGFTQAFANSFVPFSAGERDMAREAIDQWADASGLIVIEVDSGEGDIQFGRYDFDLDPQLATFIGFAKFGAIDDSSGADYTGDVFLDSETPTTTFTLLHEIGHALGFKHPFQGDPTLDPSVNDTDHTVMSYTGDPVDVLGPFDISAVQYVYGQAADSGTHVASWSYSESKGTLTQVGFATDDLIRGIHGKDKITGGDGFDTIYANGGKDSVKAGAGNDIVYGGDGDDTVDGGGGNDSIHTGWGDDSVDAGGGNDDIVDAERGAGSVETIDAGKGDDTVTFSRFEEDADQAWTFSATTGGFTLSDGTVEGTSTILGTEIFYLFLGTGDDTITFNAVGNGIYNLTDNGGDDEVVVDFSTSNSAVLSDDGSVLTSQFHKAVTFSGIEKMHVMGGTAADTLSGDDGNDTLEGNKGADLITGDLGRDTLDGGKGPDQFVYQTVAELTGPGRDTVIGFDALEDKFVVLSAVTGVDTIVTTGIMREGSFDADLATAITGAKLAAHHAVLFDPSNGNLASALFLIIDQDGTTGYDAGVDIVIQLSAANNLGSLDTTDFVS